MAERHAPIAKELLPSSERLVLTNTHSSGAELFARYSDAEYSKDFAKAKILAVSQNFYEAVPMEQLLAKLRAMIKKVSL
jgi:hypothetical protein